MNLTPYKRALAHPGVKALLAVGSASRLPYAAMGMAMLFHVRFGLGMSYFQAGLVATMLTVAAALSSPVKGRLMDRFGLRPIIGVTTIGSVAFFLAATVLPYPMLLPAAFVGGLFSMPVFGAVRQGLAALVPEGDRRPVYSLDSMGVELAFIVGPAAAITVANWNSHVALLGVAALTALSGSLLYAIDPPAQSAEERTENEGAQRPPRREWLSGPVVAMFVGAVGALVAIVGAEVAIVALLKGAGQESQAGLVMGVWAAYSLIGGFLYGALHRDVHPLLLLLGMCLALAPVGLFSNWSVVALLLAPAGLLCAPTMAAMSDFVTRSVPSTVRGEALGLHGSAITVGGAIGAPIVGGVIDAFGPVWGFVAGGGGGALLALGALVFARAASGSRRIRTAEPLTEAA